jgi:hypothetical protein
MQALADDATTAKSFDAIGREIVDDERFRAAQAKVLRLGLDAGYLAQIMRVNRNANDRATAFYAMFWVDDQRHLVELIEHLPGEPVAKVREAALPRAIEYLKRHLGRRFRDLTPEQQQAIRADLPAPGSPVARAQGITRLPEDDDALLTMRLVPFLQLLDVDSAIDRAQALWFVTEVGRLRRDLLVAWLEPSLPRVRQLLGDEDERVRVQAIELLRSIGPANLPEPPTEPQALDAWAARAEKHLFPPFRNYNDTVIELLPSPERDALAAAGAQALGNGTIVDPLTRRLDDGSWLRGCRIVTVPEELRPLAIPAGAVITKVNGAGVSDGPSLLALLQKLLTARRAPHSLIVEYVRGDQPFAVEYRVR